MNRRAFTLIELLIVVLIVLALTAIAIPLLVPSNDERRIQEASRIVTGALARARSLAIETRRPAGVILDRQDGLPEACFQLSFAEVPPTYAGGLTDSRVHIGEWWDDGRVDGIINGQVDPGEYDDFNGDGVLTPGVIIGITNIYGNPDDSWRGLVKPGDKMLIDYKGVEYTINVTPSNVDASGYIADLSDTNPWVLTSTETTFYPASLRAVDNDYNGNGTVDPGESAGGYPFQVFPSPSRSSAAPVQLPATVALNLAESSIDGLVLSDTPGDVTIMFAPGGSIASVHWDGAPLPIVPTSQLYLMLSRRELIPLNIAPAAGEPTYSFQDLGSRWIGVHHTSGIPKSATVVAIDPTLPWGTPAEKWSRIRESRANLEDLRGN